MVKRYFLLAIVCISIHPLWCPPSEAYEVEEGDEGGDENASLVDNDALEQSEEERRLREQQERAKQQGQGQQQRGNSSGPIRTQASPTVVNVNRGKGSLGDNDNEATFLARIGEDSTVPFIVELPEDWARLSKPQEKAAKKNLENSRKLFRTIIKNIEKGKDISSDVDEFLAKLSGLEFRNGQLPDDLRTTVTKMLDDLSGKITGPRKTYIDMIRIALRNRTYSDIAILRSAAVHEQEFLRVFQVLSKPVGYDKNLLLEDQPTYKDAQTYDALIKSFTGQPGKQAERVITILQQEFWKSRGIPLKADGTFDSTQSLAILDKIQNDSSIFQEPIIAKFIQQHVNELFPAPHSVNATYDKELSVTRNGVKKVYDTSVETIAISLEGKTWSEVNNALKEEEGTGYDNKWGNDGEDYYIGTFNSSDASSRYSENLLTQFLGKAVENLGKMNSSEFVKQFSQLARVQTALLPKLTELLEGTSGQTVDSFINTNLDLFRQLEQLSGSKVVYDSAMKNLKSSLAQIPSIQRPAPSFTEESGEESLPDTLNYFGSMGGYEPTRSILTAEDYENEYR